MTQPVYPLAGRFGILTYDKTLALQGDLATISGQGGSAANNGIGFMYPSRNVSLNLDTGRWNVELGVWVDAINDYVWTKHNFSAQMGFYYPEVPWGTPDEHAWLTGSYQTADLEPAGALSVWTYDGGVVISGDLLPGTDNGLLFTLAIKDSHLMYGAGGAVWHGGLWIRGIDGVMQYVHAVYPEALCSRQTLTAAQLTSITGQP